MNYLHITGFIFLTALGITIFLGIVSYWYLKGKNKKNKNKNVDAESDDPHFGI